MTPKRLRLDSLVLSKEDLPVCPRNAAGHGWVLGRTAQCHLAPHQPAQGADAHTSQVNRGRLSQPQRLEPHLDSCPKIRDFHLRAQSCRVKVCTALIG